MTFHSFLRDTITQTYPSIRGIWTYQPWMNNSIPYFYVYDFTNPCLNNGWYLQISTVAPRLLTWYSPLLVLVILMCRGVVLHKPIRSTIESLLVIARIIISQYFIQHSDVNDKWSVRLLPKDFRVNSGVSVVSIWGGRGGIDRIMRMCDPLKTYLYCELKPLIHGKGKSQSSPSRLQVHVTLLCT